MSQGVPKVRKRDKLLALVGIRRSSRSPSAVPSVASSLDGSTPSLGGQAQSTPSSPKKAQQRAFKRGPALEKDLAVLSTTYLLQDNKELRELIVLIVQLRERDEEDKLIEVLDKCGRFSVDLAHLASEASETAASAIAEFVQTVQVVGGFDRNADETALVKLKLQSSYPCLQATRGSKTGRGFSRTILAIVGSGFTIMDILKDASEAITVVPFLKPIFASVAGLLRAVQQTQVNFNEMKDLALTAGDFALRLAETCATHSPLPAELENLIQRFNRRLREIAQNCEALSQKPWSICFLQNSIYKEELSGLKTRLDTAVQQFQNANLITLHAGIQRVVVKLDQMALEALPKQADLSASRAEYMPDSRKVDVEEISKHLFEANELVMWIDGPAGVGKSTFVDHLSQQLRLAGRLAASLFLGALPTNNLGPETVIQMLSREIGKNHPKAIPKIVDAINGCNGLSLEDHVERYILEPLRSLAHPHSLIIIVDAIDQWEHHASLIKALALLNLSTSTVRLIFTSRSKPSSSQLPDLDKISMNPYRLRPVPPDIMKSFFEKYLLTVQWVDGRKASPADVNKLVDLSDGLPVWAWTVVSLLSQPFSMSPPHEILSGILTSERQVGSSGGLAELYRTAVLRLFPSPDAQTCFLQYLGAVLVLLEPLSLADFSKLVGMPPRLVGEIHSALSSIQIRSPPDSENIVYPASSRFHLSFLETFQATAPPTGDNTLTISAFDSHSRLGLACLEMVCDLLPSLAHQTSSRSYPLQGFQRYAIKYWVLHVSYGTHRTQDEWLPTPQCSALQAITPDALQQWAAVFLNMMLREGKEVAVNKNVTSTGVLTMIVDSLGADDGDHWVFEVACLEVAVRLGSGCDQVWDKLGRYYRIMGDTTGSPKMYEEAVFAFRRVLELRPAPQEDRSLTLTDLGTVLYLLHTRIGDINVVHEAILHLRDAVALQPAPHPDRRSTSLNNLGLALEALYKSNGDVNALHEAISHLRDAVALRPLPHPDRSASLNNLATTLRNLYSRIGDVNALHEAISHLRDAVALRPPPHPDRSTSLNNLADALYALYKRNGDVNALHEAILHHRDALALRPLPHPDRSTSLNNLAIALRNLYCCIGDVNALHEAIPHLRDAIALQPPPHPNRPMSLNNLAIALHTLYSCIGDVNALHEAILHHRDALALRPPPHPDRPMSLNNLASALHGLYSRIGDVNALHEAISHLRDAVALLPPPHPDRSASLNNLADSLHTIYESNGDVNALHEAILHHRDALALRPPPHPDRSISLSNLGLALHTIYNHVGDVNALHEAISHLRDAVALQPPPHPERSTSLNNLATALQALYRCIGDVNALHEAILHRRDVLALLPASHPNRSASFNNLATALHTLYYKNGDISTLNEAILRCRDALALLLAPDPNRHFPLSTLGNALRTLYERNKDVNVLNESILQLRDALSLQPALHPARPNLLMNLAKALLYQHRRAGELGSLDEAIQLCHELLALHLPEDCDRASYVEDSIEVLETRFAITAESADGEEIQALQRKLGRYKSELEEQRNGSGEGWEADSDTDEL